MELLIIVIALALIFDFINGFHDAANSIATIVSTKVLTPFQAVLWAAFFNFIAFLIFKDHAVANTIGKTVYSDFITLPVILSGLIGSIAWNLVTWYYGIPSSSSHTLIGGFAGAALCHAFITKGFMPINEIIDSGKINKTIWFIFLAPIIGMMISIFYTLVFIQLKTWLKVGILVLTSAVLYLVFTGFQENKINENLKKFFKVDKYTYELEIKHDNSVAEKLKQAKENSDKCKPFAKLYETKGAAVTVDSIVNHVDLTDAAISKTNEKVALFFKLEMLKYKAKNDKSFESQYNESKEIVDSIKLIVNKNYKHGNDSLLSAIYTSFGKEIRDKNKFKKTIIIDIKKELIKEVEKANNKYLRIAIILSLLVFALSFIYTEKIKERTVSRTVNSFKKMQLMSSAAFSIGHGGNDAQKVMGIIAAALITSGNLTDIKSMPDWVPLSCYLAIGLGTLSGGWRIVKTMGSKITKVTPLEGVSAETAGATTLFLTEQMGIPVSTTHTITGSIVGVGLVKGVSSVKWGVTISLLWAWVLTIPVTAIIAAAVYFLVQFFV
ncbi:MAG: inorganic phosphate transporter [Bacteroidetes bacterium]|nr:inorganic phosphate transporter [Bacteroidota bacterium]